MTAGSFDPITARAFIGDETARQIEASAREAAERGLYAPGYPDRETTTFAAAVRLEMERVVYNAAFGKRQERIKRKAES